MIGAVERGGCVPQVFVSSRAEHAGHVNPNCSKVKFSRHRLQSACRGIEDELYRVWTRKVETIIRYTLPYSLPINGIENDRKKGGC